jgi:hypothetical protein
MTMLVFHHFETGVDEIQEEEEVLAKKEDEDSVFSASEMVPGGMDL